MKVKDKVREGYKLTELGEIPVEWDIKSINKLVEEKIILEIQDGNHGEKHPTTDDYISNGIPFIMASDISKGKINLLNCKFISYQKSKFLTKGFAKPGDVLLTHKGTIGQTAVVPDSIDLLILSPQVTYYRVNKQINKLNNVFLKYFFDSYMFQRSIKKLAAQSTRDYVGITNQKSLLIILPTLPEQKKIAEILATLDEQIEQTEQLIEKTKELKKGLMQKLLTKGIGHTRFKKTELGEIPEEWEVKTVGEIANINPNYRLKKGEIYDYIEMAALPTEGKKIKNRSKREYGITSGSKFKNGDTLFARITPCTENGKMGLVDSLETEYGIGSTEFIVISPKEVIVPEFLFYYLRLDKVRQYAISRMVGTTGRQRVPKEIFEQELLIPLPPLPEQKKIADILSAVDEQIEQNEQLIEKTKKIKKALMQKLLTGKIRVKV